MLGVLIAGILTDLIMLAVFLFMPVMRGEELFFGVRVSPEYYREEGRNVLRRYQFWLTMTFLQIELLGILTAIFRDRPVFSWGISTAFLLFATTVLYINSYRQVKCFAISEPARRFASSLKPRRMSDYTNVAIEVVVPIIFLAPVLALIYYYPALPERIPVHWDWRGQPDRWVQKSIGAVFFLPAMMAYLQGLFLLLKYGLMQTKLTLPADHTEEYFNLKEQALSANLGLIDWVRLIITVMMGSMVWKTVLLAFNTPPHLGLLATSVLIMSTVALLGVVAYYIFRLIAIDSRLKESTGRIYVEREDQSESWYGGGLCYYNPDDPAIFVEKKVGLGYTINFGNPRSVLFLVYLVGLPILLGWAFLAL